MAKYFGKIGFAIPTEIRKGVWKDVITERDYYGDVIKNGRRLQITSQLNDNVNAVNTISIVADPYANENFYAMRYLTWIGNKWKISEIDVQYPRLILTLGGVYNVKQTLTPNTP